MTYQKWMVSTRIRYISQLECDGISCPVVDGVEFPMVVLEVNKIIQNICSYHIRKYIIYIFPNYIDQVYPRDFVQSSFQEPFYQHSSYKRTIVTVVCFLFFMPYIACHIFADVLLQKDWQSISKGSLFLCLRVICIKTQQPAISISQPWFSIWYHTR